MTSWRANRSLGAPALDQHPILRSFAGYATVGAGAGAGGHIDVVHSNYGTIGEHARAGTLKILGISTADRIDLAPDAPTYKELGYDIVLSHWRGVLCSKEVPDDVVIRMRELLKKTIHDPEFEKFMADNNVNYADTFASSDEFTQWFLSEVEAFKELL